MIIKATSKGRRAAPLHFHEQSGGAVSLKSGRALKNGAEKDIAAPAAEKLIAAGLVVDVTPPANITSEERDSDGHDL